MTSSGFVAIAFRFYIIIIISKNNEKNITFLVNQSVKNFHKISFIIPNKRQLNVTEKLKSIYFKK